MITGMPVRLSIALLMLLGAACRSAAPLPVAVVAPFGTRYILLPNPMYGSWQPR